MPWDHASPQPERHFDRFSRVCADDRRVSLYFTMVRPFPFKIAPSHWRISTEFHRGFDFGCAFSRFVASTAQRHHTPCRQSIRRAADVDGRRHLRSSNTESLVVPSTRRSTLGDHAFLVTAVTASNDLPPTIIADYILT